MADFSIAFSYLISNEDYAPDDPRYGKVHTDNDGGKVRFGLNSNSYPELLTTTFYTTMPNDEALLLARNLYNITRWKSIQGDAITSQRVASKILDMSVNEGVVEASKLVQRAVGANVDGVIGPLTVTSINNENEDVVLKGLVYWWLWLIEQIVKVKPQDKEYEDAWTARAEKLPV